MRSARLGLAAAAALGLSACASFRPVGAPVAGDELTPSAPPEGGPGERQGWLAWQVGGLRFEAPAGWSARGDARRLVLDAGAARLEAWVVEARYRDGRACLEEAEASLERGEAQLARVRRHTTTLAGRAALVQEADAGGWHGWAYAVCLGAVQHRLFFTGRSPVSTELLDAWRAVLKSARPGGAA